MTHAHDRALTDWARNSQRSTPMPHLNLPPELATQVQKLADDLGEDFDDVAVALIRAGIGADHDPQRATDLD